MMISGFFVFVLFVSSYAKNVNAIEKMSRSDYDLLGFFSIESGGRCQLYLFFFQRVLSLELFGSKSIYFEDFQDYYGNFGKVQSKDCSPITNCFE